MVFSIKVLSIVVFTLPKILIINLLSQLEYLILKYLILFKNAKKLLQYVYPQKIKKNQNKKVFDLKIFNQKILFL